MSLFFFYSIGSLYEEAVKQPLVWQCWFVLAKPLQILTQIKQMKTFQYANSADIFQQTCVLASARQELNIK